MQVGFVHLKRQVMLAASVVFVLSISARSGEKDGARAILDQAKAAREGLKNYRCSVDYTDESDYAARKREFEEASRAKDVFPEMIESLKEELDGSGRKYEVQTVVGDSTGRMRITETLGRYGPDGSKSITYQTDTAWDGAMNVFFSPRPKPGLNGAAITPVRSAHFVLTRHPVYSFGEKFLAAMDKAVASGGNLDIQKGTDGLLEVRFTCGDPADSGNEGLQCAWAGRIDPSKGFTVPRWEFTLPNGYKWRFTATFAEVSDGVWFPTEGRVEGFFADGMPNGRTSVKIANVIVNDPNMDARAFHIDLPEGTCVTDRIAGTFYIVGDPASIRPLGVSTPMTPSMTH